MTPGMLPNLIVIGAQKCGTSALHSYLDAHPDVAMSRPKELDFFIAKRGWRNAVDWYGSHWRPGTAVRGESSPNYTAHPHFGDVPALMHHVVPDARLIYLVRDPIERMVSQYVHQRAQGGERRKLTEALVAPERTFLTRSRYMHQLERFLRFYDPAQVLVVDAADLRDRRADTLATVYAFLGVDPTFTAADHDRAPHRTADKRQLNRTGGWVMRTFPPPVGRRLARHLRLGPPVTRPDVTAELRERLAEVLADDAARFRAFTGRAFAAWSV